MLSGKMSLYAHEATLSFYTSRGLSFVFTFAWTLYRHCCTERSALLRKWFMVYRCHATDELEAVSVVFLHEHSHCV